MPPPASPRQAPVLADLRVDAAALAAALGQPGEPVTVHCSDDALRLTTPTRSTRIPATVRSHAVAGTYTTGLRPTDADRLRTACPTTGLVDITIYAGTVLLQPAAGAAARVPSW